MGFVAALLGGAFSVYVITSEDSGGASGPGLGFGALSLAFAALSAALWVAPAALIRVVLLASVGLLGQYATSRLAGAGIGAAFGGLVLWYRTL